MKRNFDTILGNIMIWISIFIALWILTPIDFRLSIAEERLPGLPDYTYFYLVYLTITTAVWTLLMSILHALKVRGRAILIKQKQSDKRCGIKQEDAEKTK